MPTLGVRCGCVRMSDPGKGLPVPKHERTGLYIKDSPGLKLRDRKTTRLAQKVRSVLTWAEPSDYPARTGDTPMRMWRRATTSGRSS